VETSWTKWLRNYGDGSIPVGIRRYLDDNPLIDGILIDTPFDTDNFEWAENPWHAVNLIDQIRAEIHPKIVMPNFGDADTWMGRTSVAKALAAITDWHFVEVFLEMNKSTEGQWFQRMDAVERAHGNDKRLVLGIYDEKGDELIRARSLMGAYWNGRVFWHYKINLNEWGLIV
jgi:hypothetical protein